MDTDALRAFVAEAHRNGYATSEPDVDDEAAGKRIRYADGEWEYLDRYVGGRRFVGHEVVRRDGAPVWGMHYYGAPTEETVDVDALYAFLREALEAASAEHPFRGPLQYASEPWTYECAYDGDIERCRGTEQIERDGAIVYRGEFGGGLVE